LLDSVVKEQLVKPFVSTEARILQHLFIPSSVIFENLFSTQPLALSISSASRQREAHSTAFKLAVNTSFSPLSICSTEAPTGLNHHPASPAHSTRIRRQRNLFFHPTP